jgi:exopolysaccharide biosynthesis protein
MKIPDFLRDYCLLLLAIFAFASCTTPRTQEQKSAVAEDTLQAVQITTDSLYNSHQRICMLVLDKKDIHRYQMLFTYHANDLNTTSYLAENRGALAAINGSFFDVDNGGSVTYFEVNDSVISRTRESGLKWAVPDSLANGAIILTKQHTLEIEAAKREQFYEESQREEFVLISGPLLISSSLAQHLPDMKFTQHRHPRTCLGITEESLIFMTVDGRTEQADGMSLYELQQYLLDLGCTYAINLDGGGSTTLWTDIQGVVNNPSDRTGERPVANALLILNNQANK